MTAVLILARFAHFASAMALFGASVFFAALAPPLLRGVLAARVRRLAIAASLLGAASAAFWLLLESGEMGGGWRDAIDPGAIALVLADTGFGHVWQARLLLGLAVIVAALWRGVPPALLAVVSGLVLASLGLVGHAALQGGLAGLLGRANQALHLAAGGFWLGALAPLLLCLRRADDPALKDDVSIALRRFSGLGHVAVAAVLATGAINIFTILGHAPTNFSSPYQASLAMKIVAVSAMVLLALYNRYRLAPRFALRRDAALALARNTAIEIALGGLVLALVSAFATFEPV